MKKAAVSLASWSARNLPAGVRRALYRMGPLTRLIRGLLNRSVTPGQTEVAVAAGQVAGFRMILDLQKEKDYWLGTYEPDLQEAIARFVKPGMVAYDVGANIGYISLMLARRTGDHGQVTAFEALPANLVRLRANVELNGLSDKVKIISGAVIDSDAPVRFLVHQSGSMGKADGSAGHTDKAYDEQVTVPGIALDKFVFENGNMHPDVIKMDIEGGEVLAVRGMKRILEELQPFLLIELHGFEAAQVVVQALWENGYRVHRLQSGYPVVSSLEELDWKAYIMGAPGDLE